MEDTPQTPELLTLADVQAMLEDMKSQSVDMAPPPAHHGTPAQLAALYGALASAQGEFGTIVKNRNVTIEIKHPDTKVKIGSYVFKYADLEEVTAKTRPALSKFGLGIIQPITFSAAYGGTSIYTQLFHKDGGMIISELNLPIGHKDIKNLGANISYLRRYAKTALLDLAADDDADEQPTDISDSNNSAAANASGGQETKSVGRETIEGYWSPEDFEKNLVGYTAAIRKGRTADQMIATISTKKKLTDDQIQTLRDVEAAAANQQEDNQ